MPNYIEEKSDVTSFIADILAKMTPATKEKAALILTGMALSDSIPEDGKASAKGIHPVAG